MAALNDLSCKNIKNSLVFLKTIRFKAEIQVQFCCYLHLKKISDGTSATILKLLMLAVKIILTGNI